MIENKRNKRIVELVQKGYAYRDIQVLIVKEGFRSVSLGGISKIVKRYERKLRNE